MTSEGANPSQRIVSSIATKYSSFSASGCVSSNLRIYCVSTVLILAINHTRSPTDRPAPVASGKTEVDSDRLGVPELVFVSTWVPTNQL